MGFLELLQQRRQQGDGLSRALSALGAGLADTITQGKAEAKEQAKLYQQLGGVMLQSGRGKDAAELLPKFREAVKTGYGVDLPNTSVVGAPVMAQVPNPDFIGPMPLGQTAMKRIEMGRDFGGEQTLDAIRGGLMLEKPKAPALDLFKASPYENVIDTRTGKVVLAAQPKPAPEAAPRMGWVGDVYQELRPGVTRPTREAAPRAQRDDTPRLRQQWESGRLRYVEDYVNTMSKTLPMREDADGKMFRTPAKPEQIDAWRKQAQAYYDANVTRPFEQPGSGQAAPAVRGTRSAAIMPPKDYNDTGLLPEWEKLAQQAVSLAPGAAISSKARSKERNANAGGTATSWHQYRQAFDLVVPRPEDRARLIQWGRQRGLEVIDEGDHLHFEPARSSDAMRNFYAKHGLESDDA
ncbi:MAG: hypothetical protein VKP62_06445 [Candidatus Sericytochromatia bacterium]|nr:hypothetical protein [Candidatus Sericytochromatia bacterium]